MLAGKLVVVAALLSIAALNKLDLTPRFSKGDARAVEGSQAINQGRNDFGRLGAVDHGSVHTITRSAALIAVPG